MSNTSRTGGYLAPLSTSGNLDDVLFLEFLQPIVVGITSIPGTLVFPRWQKEPPNLPAYGTDWAAVGSTRRQSDTFAAVTHVPAVGATPGYDQVFRNQVIDILCSFYGPNSEANSDLLIMGFQVSQNRESMLLAGFGFIGCDGPIITADLINEQWTRRIDVAFQVRRAQLFTYPVLDLVSALATIQTDQGLPNVVVVAQ